MHAVERILLTVQPTIDLWHDVAQVKRIVKLENNRDIKDRNFIKAKK